MILGCVPEVFHEMRCCVTVSVPHGAPTSHSQDYDEEAQHRGRRAGIVARLGQNDPDRRCAPCPRCAGQRRIHEKLQGHSLAKDVCLIRLFIHNTLLYATGYFLIKAMI